MYTDILYPTDGSEGADAAMNNCRDLAEKYDATVHVLFVAESLHPHGLSSDVEVTGESGGMIGDPKGDESGMSGKREKDAEVQAAVEEHAAGILDDVATQLDGVDARTVLREGVPYEVILKYADEEDIDLIVMGTHGRTGVDRYLLGSVTEKVVRMSDVPVLTVRLDEES